MTDLSFLKPLSKFKWHSRQAASTTTDGLRSLGRHIDPPQTISHTSTKFVGRSESKDDHRLGNGQTLADRGRSPQAQTINVMLIGETGVGKSSVINLIARKEIARVSSDVNRCTMQCIRYDIPFDNMNFAIFDTISLEGPQLGANGYLNAIEKAHELVNKLGAAGGIHLLLFCMRGGRMTATTQSNYRLFCECLCNTKAPVALVFTGLEGEVDMEDWWRRNKVHLENYGIKSDGHACITAVSDDTPEGEDKYLKSQVTIRELLKTCAGKGTAFSLESHSWLAKIAGELKSFVPTAKGPKDRDIMKVLTQRCKLDAVTAKRIADMMEKDDTGNKDSQANPEGGKESELAENQTNDDASPGEHDPTTITPEENEAEVTLPRYVNAALGVVSGNEKNIVDGALLQTPSNGLVAPRFIANAGNDFVAGKSVASGGPVPFREFGNIGKAAPNTSGKERNNVGENGKFDRRNTRKQGDPSGAGFPFLSLWS